jgi:hypothetical protein
MRYGKNEHARELNTKIMSICMGDTLFAKLNIRSEAIGIKPGTLARILIDRGLEDQPNPKAAKAAANG